MSILSPWEVKGCAYHLRKGVQATCDRVYRPLMKSGQATYEEWTGHL